MFKPRHPDYGRQDTEKKDRLGGKSTGGASKMAVVSSAFLGTLTGDPISNVGLSGFFTPSYAVVALTASAMAGANFYKTCWQSMKLAVVAYIIPLTIVLSFNKKELDMAEDRPEGWKNFEDFATGIATNRLPRTEEFINTDLRIVLADKTDLTCRFLNKNCCEWKMAAGPHAGSSGKDWYEAIEVGENVYFMDMLFRSRPRDAISLIVNTATRRVLTIVSKVAEKKAVGKTQVEQHFLVGTIGDPDIPPEGPEPAPTRDLIGLRTINRYSPNHVYEHVYLSSERYCWQNLVGVQRGHGDVDMATTYRFDEDLYLFTFREFLIPVASVFFYNMRQMRSTGKFLGVTSKGEIENKPAGAFIQKTSMTFYAPGEEPV